MLGTFIGLCSDTNRVCMLISFTAVNADTELPSPPELSLVFPASTFDQQRCVEIPIASDTLLEGDHEFTIVINSAGSAPHALLNQLSSVTTVTIFDDDSEYIHTVYCWMCTVF